MLLAREEDGAESIDSPSPPTGKRSKEILIKATGVPSAAKAAKIMLDLRRD
jgi:hypothetical protein